MLKQLVGRPAEWITTFDSTLELLLFLPENVWNFEFSSASYIELKKKCDEYTLLYFLNNKVLLQFKKKC